MYYEGGFVYGIATGDTNKDLKWGETIDWFDFPIFDSAKGVTIGGDVIAALTDEAGRQGVHRVHGVRRHRYHLGQDGHHHLADQGRRGGCLPERVGQAGGRPGRQRDGRSVRRPGSPPAGGPDFGAMLQSVIKGEAIDGLTGPFHTAQKAAWATE